jgi:hypothetical protein
MENLYTTALKYVEQKEIKGNMGFKDKAFDKLMRLVGFYNTAPWCAFFVKFCIRQYYGEKSRILNFIGGSALTNYEKLEDNGFVTSAIPKQGCIVVWRMYKNGRPQGRNGHIGIVGSFNPTSFDTVEGNTNASGGREGDCVATKIRGYNWTENNGLRLLGFVHLD